ncbi:MAG TPA: GNAT family N-acetyltransferase [Myxococcota bacterium]
MNPELALCAHFARLAERDLPPEVAHAFLFQDGPIDAVVRCRDCGAHALLRLLDWAPADFSLRIFGLAALRAADSALFLRDLERGSCQVARAATELAALVAAAGPTGRIVAIDFARERVVASAPAPRGMRSEPDEFPARLPRADDERWFAALGLEKLTETESDRVKLTIAPANLGKEPDVSDFLALLDAYARDPMGGGAPLAGEVRARLLPDLKARMLRGDALVLIARRGELAVGVAVCLASYSTFMGRPALNVHDLAVVPEERGKGVGRALLQAIDDAARERRCGKVTLEVREDNARARQLYESTGFVDYAPGGARTRTFFLEKKL